MKNLVFFFLLTMIVSACGQTESKKADAAQTLKTNANGTSQTTPVLDSIEKANSESVTASGENITKAYISKSDNSISLSANIKQDHRIFGYEKPDIHSKRLLLVSVFTSDVENNPFKCELGAYYDTYRMENLSLKYISTEGEFLQAIAVDKDNKITKLYFEKKWFEFE